MAETRDTGGGLAGVWAWLLGTDPEMQRRLRLALIAAVLYGLWFIGFAVWTLVRGEVDPMVWVFFADEIGGMSFYVAMRAGWTRRLKDPALVLPQMLYAGMSCAIAYICLPELRPGVWQLACLVQVFGLFNLRPRALLVSGFATVAMLLGAAALSFRLGIGDTSAVTEMQVVSGALMLALLTLASAHHAKARSRLRETRAELADAVRRTELLATRDPLTGLPNRQHAQDQLLVDLARHDEGGPPLCLAFLDLDHFKGVNDTHGHAAGDAVLQRFAEEVRAELREIDLFARWGGEEFLLVLRDTGSLDVAEGVLARIRARLEAAPLVWGEGVCIRIGFSAGVAAREPRETLDQAVQRADVALYRAKANGRGRTERARAARHGEPQPEDETLTMW
jgi:diguanylate cyclase (GGDEF)-like protein